MPRLVNVCRAVIHHEDTESTKVAQRRCRAQLRRSTSPCVGNCELITRCERRMMVCLWLSITTTVLVLSGIGPLWRTSSVRQEVGSNLTLARCRPPARCVSTAAWSRTRSRLVENCRWKQCWLEKAYQERHPFMTLIGVEPVFDPVRSDPRFVELVRRVGLPS